MHEGILAADRPWPDVLTALQGHIGTLEDQGFVAPAQWLELPQGEDAFHVTSRDGRSYVLDPAMVLTSSPDLVVSLSHELDCAVPRSRGGFDLQYQPPSERPSLIKRLFGR